MNRRQYKQKTISEFLTSRSDLGNPISSITSKFNYSDSKDCLHLQYVSKLMSSSSKVPEILIQKEKYRIIGGKLHIYSGTIEGYVPVERTNYIDIVKHSGRMKNDYGNKRCGSSKGLMNTWITDNTVGTQKTCSRESSRQGKSILALSLRKPQNFSMSKSSLHYKSSEMLSERGPLSSFKLAR